MGRGQPLPPPGTPLPPPGRKTKTAPIPVPKRKPIPQTLPPPNLPQRPKLSESEPNGSSIHRYPVPPPPLPKRRDESRRSTESADDGLLVVEAPANDSEPTTPMSELAPSYMPPWVEDADEAEETTPDRAQPRSLPPSVVAMDLEPPRLPKRRPPHRVLSSSPEEDGHKLPSWVAAQEEEARAKSTFVDEDAGL
jgi:hypothetical protein